MATTDERTDRLEATDIRVQRPKSSKIHMVSRRSGGMTAYLRSQGIGVRPFLLDLPVAVFPRVCRDCRVAGCVCDACLADDAALTKYLQIRPSVSDPVNLRDHGTGGENVCCDERRKENK